MICAIFKQFYGKKIVPLFYNRGEDKLPRGWITMMKNSMKKLGPIFNTHRMVQEYAQKFYFKAYEKRIYLMSNNWKKAKEYYETAIFYGWDSLSVFHNIGLVYLRNEIEDLSSKAGELFKKGVELYPNSFGTYNVLFAYLMLDSFKNPQNEAKNIKDFEYYMKKLKKVCKPSL
jgi:tetratricopeptide (TPR) repeat protein